MSNEYVNSYKHPIEGEGGMFAWHEKGQLTDGQERGRMVFHSTAAGHRKLAPKTSVLWFYEDRIAGWTGTSVNNSVTVWNEVFLSVMLISMRQCPVAWLAMYLLLEACTWFVLKGVCVFRGVGGSCYVNILDHCSWVSAGIQRWSVFIPWYNSYNYDYSPLLLGSGRNPYHPQPPRNAIRSSGTVTDNQLEESAFRISSWLCVMSNPSRHVTIMLYALFSASLSSGFDPS